MTVHTYQDWTPNRLKGVDLEDLCKRDIDKCQKHGIGTMDKCGVQVRWDDRHNRWQPIKSLVDFNGVVVGGREFNLECKVCSDASFALGDNMFKERQLSFLLRRAKFRALSILLIHFNKRQLKTAVNPPFTVAIPVCPTHPLWKAVLAGQLKRIRRDIAEDVGQIVRWRKWPKGRTFLPDVSRMLINLMESEDARHRQPA